MTETTKRNYKTEPVPIDYVADVPANVIGYCHRDNLLCSIVIMY